MSMILCRICRRISTRRDGAGRQDAGQWPCGVVATLHSGTFLPVHFCDQPVFQGMHEREMPAAPRRMMVASRFYIVARGYMLG